MSWIWTLKINSLTELITKHFLLEKRSLSIRSILLTPVFTAVLNVVCILRVSRGLGRFLIGDYLNPHVVYLNYVTWEIRRTAVAEGSLVRRVVLRHVAPLVLISLGSLLSFTTWCKIQVLLVSFSSDQWTLGEYDIYHISRNQQTFLFLLFLKCSFLCENLSNYKLMTGLHILSVCGPTSMLVFECVCVSWHIAVMSDSLCRIPEVFQFSGLGIDLTVNLKYSLFAFINQGFLICKKLL